MATESALYWLSALIYVVNGTMATMSFSLIKRCQLDQNTMNLGVKAFLVLVIVKSAFFVVLKIAMVKVGNMPPLNVAWHGVWLVYEWLSGITIMTFVIVIRSYLQWRCAPGVCPHPFRRAGD